MLGNVEVYRMRAKRPSYRSPVRVGQTRSFDDGVVPRRSSLRTGRGVESGDDVGGIVIMEDLDWLVYFVE